MYNDIIIEILPFPVKFAKEETVSKKEKKIKNTTNGLYCFLKNS